MAYWFKSGPWGQAVYPKGHLNLSELQLPFLEKADNNGTYKVVVSIKQACKAQRMLSGLWYALSKGELLVEYICKYRFIAKVQFEVRVNLNIILPLDILFSPYSLHRIR